MSKFTDTAGREWTVEFDCFLLDRVRKEADVDLADISAVGLLAIEQDVTALVRVLSVVCADQWKTRGLTARDFQKPIRQDALIRARDAVMEALADFFPQSAWSAMRSSSQTRASRPEMSAQDLQLATGFLKLAPEVQRDVMTLIQQEMASGSSPLSEREPSASVSDAMPQSPADDSPESAESVPEA